MNQKISASQKDIANALGVSVNTVSHALRDLPDISEGMKKKIKEKAEELGYIPNSLAASIKTGRSNVIALVFDNMQNPYFVTMANFMIDKIQSFGYDVLVYPSKSRIFNENILRQVLLRRIDGVISFLEANTLTINACKKNHIPLIMVGRTVPGSDITSIYTDDEKGGRLAGSYFKEKNAKKVAYLGPSNIECSLRRQKGLIDVYGLNVKICRADYDEEVIKMVKESLKEECDSFFCFNDMIAYSCINYLKSQGIKLPVVGFDNINSVYPIGKDITSITYDYKFIAHVTVDKLIEIINGNESDSSMKVDVSLHIGKY